MSEQKGIFILVAGPNASGKTTVIKPKYVENRVNHYLDPDRLLPIAQEDILGEKSRKEYESKRSARFAVECMEDWLGSERIRNEGIATESNLVSKRDFTNLRKAKESGMQTELYFVGIPAELSVQREQIRANAGAQEKIPESTIRDRHSKGLSNIEKHIDSGNIDKIMVYDNSRSTGEEQLLLHVENSRTLFLHPNPPQWFRDAEIEFPPLSEKQAEQQTQNNGQTVDKKNNAVLAVKNC